MGEWTSYEIQDFILFSQEVYLAVITNYNKEIWPAQLFWLVASVVLLFSVVRARHKTAWGRIASALIAGGWVWVGAIFHSTYFLPINWAAKYFAWLCFVEAALFLVVGLLGRKLQFQQAHRVVWWLGLTVLVLSLFAPLELLWGYSLSHLQLFGWGADRTALATIGALLLCRLSWSSVLLFIPALLWSLVAGLMYYGLAMN